MCTGLMRNALTHRQLLTGLPKIHFSEGHVARPGAKPRAVRKWAELCGEILKGPSLRSSAPGGSVITMPHGQEEAAPGEA